MTTAVALGALVGLVLALTGAGGGSLAVPLLIFALGMNVSQAAPVALFAVGLAAMIGAAFGLRAGHVRYRAAALMAGVGFLGAPVGWYLGRHIPNGPLTLIFAAVLAYTSLRMLRPAGQAAAAAALPLARLPPCRLDPVEGRLHWTAACARALGSAGFAAGVLSALLGVGGGFVIVPALLRVSDLDMPSVSVTSMSVIALVAVASIAIYGYAGQEIDWRIAAPFAAGALAGVLGGRQLARRLPGARLQQAFACIGLIVVAMLLWRSLARA